MASPSTAELIRAIERASSALALLEATQALASATETQPDPAAIDALVQVLGFNNPGAAVAAVEGLIRLGPVAVGPLLDTLDPQNYGARAWAVRALSGIGDVRGVEVLEDALATDVGPSVRRAAARGLGNLHLDDLGEEERQTLNQRCLAALEEACTDAEWVVSYAVPRALDWLAHSLQPVDALGARPPDGLNPLAQPSLEDTPVVRLRADLALRRLNDHPVEA
jgi:phycocyanobilin lyase beta subunit